MLSFFNPGFKLKCFTIVAGTSKTSDTNKNFKWSGVKFSSGKQFLMLNEVKISLIFKF